MKLPFIRRPRPDWFAFQWHITDACDQRCRHCYIYASGASPQEMAWADMSRVVEACEEFCRINDRSPVYYLTGGDPLLHPRFWQLMELLHGRRAPVVILGNPFHLTILPNGDVYACRRVAGSRVGSVLTQSLADLWADGMSAYRQYDRFEKCAHCELQPWCRGCPAVAAGTSGSFYAPDPQCWKEAP